jgi:DUF917 family protein
MVIDLSEQVIRNLVRGWSFVSTGGGSKSAQLESVLFSYIQGNQGARVVSLSELSDEDMVCSVYGVGVAGNSETFLRQAITTAVNKLRDLLGREIAAVFPGETNSSRAFQAAGILDIPVLDADATGGRAVPEVQVDNFFLFGQTTAPIVVASPSGDYFCIHEFNQPEDIEKQIRSYMLRSGFEVVAVADHAISVGCARGLLTEGVILRGIGIGELLSEVQQLPTLIDNLKSKFAILFKFRGLISNISLIKEGGFLSGTCTIACPEGDVVILVKNESLALQLNGKTVIEAPESILLLDSGKRVGVHNSELQVGTEVLIFSAFPDRRWDCPRGRRLYFGENS